MRSLQSLNLQPVLSTEGMRNLDAASKGFLAKKTASDPSENDVIQSGYTLMQEAGLALYKFVQSKALAPIAIFIGSGNNGGDGLVLAKLLLQAGIQSTVFSLAPESKFKNEAKLALDDFLQAGGSLFDFKKIIEEPRQASLLLHDGFKLIVDCMLGNGAKGELRLEFATAVETINGSGLPVIAADAPTGYDSGAHIRNNICIHANETMLFGFPRLDAYTKEGGPAFGKAVVAPLSYPDKVVLTKSSCNLTKRITSSQKKQFRNFCPSAMNGATNEIKGPRSSLQVPRTCRAQQRFAQKPRSAAARD